MTAFEPGKEVAWHVEDAKINFVENETEWNGTDIIFTISREDGRTVVSFTHIGLVPSIQCYGGCTGAWEFYVNDSLKSLITTGKGEPENLAKAGTE